MNTQFGMLENVFPLLIPLDRTATAAATPYVDLKTVNSLSFLVYYGALTGASTGDAVTVTVECSSTSASSASEVAIAFKYRKSAATGTNTWGAVTDATSSGVTMAENADDNKALLIEVDPAVVAAAKSDARYVRLVLTPAGSYSASTGAVIGFIDPIYKQTTMISAAS